MKIDKTRTGHRQVSCSPEGEIQYEEGLLYITFEDMGSLKEKILSEPENYEIIPICLKEKQGELSLSGSAWPD